MYWLLGIDDFFNIIINKPTKRTILFEFEIPYTLVHHLMFSHLIIQTFISTQLNSSQHDNAMKIITTTTNF